MWAVELDLRHLAVVGGLQDAGRLWASMETDNRVSSKRAPDVETARSSAWIQMT
jgi:hypothetical protein